MFSNVWIVFFWCDTAKWFIFFSIGRKEKKCLIYQWWKSWLALVLDEIFMLPLELRLEALCFQAIPPSVPFSQLWYLLRNFRFDPIVHLDSRKPIQFQFSILYSKRSQVSYLVMSQCCQNRQLFRSLFTIIAAEIVSLTDI